MARAPVEHRAFERGHRGAPPAGAVHRGDEAGAGRAVEGQQRPAPGPAAGGGGEARDEGVEHGVPFRAVGDEGRGRGDEGREEGPRDAAAERADVARDSVGQGGFEPAPAADCDEAQGLGGEAGALMRGDDVAGVVRMRGAGPREQVVPFGRIRRVGRAGLDRGGACGCDHRGPRREKAGPDRGREAVDAVRRERQDAGAQDRGQRHPERRADHAEGRHEEEAGADGDRQHRQGDAGAEPLAAEHGQQVLARAEQARGDAAGGEHGEDRDAVGELRAEHRQQQRAGGDDGERHEGGGRQGAAALQAHEPGQRRPVADRMRRAEALRGGGDGGEVHEHDELLDAGRGEVQADRRGRHQEAEHHHVDEGEAGVGQVDQRDRQAGAEPVAPAVAARPLGQGAGHPRDHDRRLDRHRQDRGGEHAGHRDPGVGRRPEQDRGDHRDHHHGLAHEVGRRDRQHRPVLAAGEAFQEVLEREQRQHQRGDEERRPVGSGDPIGPQRQDRSAETGDEEGGRADRDGAGHEVAAGVVEVAAGLVHRQEAAGALRQAEGDRMADHRGPDPDRGEDAVFLPAHQPGGEHLRAVGEAGRGDADREHVEGGAGGAGRGGAQAVDGRAEGRRRHVRLLDPARIGPEP